MCFSEHALKRGKCACVPPCGIDTSVLEEAPEGWIREGSWQTGGRGAHYKKRMNEGKRQKTLSQEGRREVLES